MSPGEQAYAQVRHLLDRDWSALSDEERETWERGASTRPVGATLHLTQADNTKVA